MDRAHLKEVFQQALDEHHENLQNLEEFRQTLEEKQRTIEELEAGGGKHFTNLPTMRDALLAQTKEMRSALERGWQEYRVSELRLEENRRKLHEFGQSIGNFVPSLEIPVGNPIRNDSRSGGRWEYKSIKIPLNLKLDKNNYTPSTSQERSIENLVLQHLQREGEQGWQSDTPTNYRSLSIDYHDDKGIFNMTRILDSVTVRLKRFVL